MDARSIPAIALNAFNEHGGHYFMSLYSGKRIHSYEWKELPIDEEVIARVEELAEEEEAPEMKRGYPIFTWKRRIIEESDLNINDAIEDTIDIDVLNENIEEQGNEIPEQELEVNENENVNEIINDEEPIQEETNYVTDESSINNENDSEEDGLDDMHVMDEIPEETIMENNDDNNDSDVESEDEILRGFEEEIESFDGKVSDIMEDINNSKYEDNIEDISVEDADT